MLSINDDDVIKRRLLLEGDSGSDDRRLGLLLRLMVRWYGSEECGSPDELTDNYHRVLSLISQSEHAMDRTLLVQHMNEAEQANYEDLNSRIEQSIKLAQEQIEK